MRTIIVALFCLFTAASLSLAELSPSPVPSPDQLRDIAASEIDQITLEVETSGQTVSFRAAGRHYAFGTLTREPETLSLQLMLLAQLRAAKSISVKATPVGRVDEPNTVFYISTVQFHY